MDCEFCAQQVAGDEPENLALLNHLGESPECNEQYEYLIENLNASWTKAMSGG